MTRIIDQDDADQLYRIFPDIPKSHLFGCPSCGKNCGEMVDGVLELNGVRWRCNCHDQLQRQKHYTSSGIGMNYQFLSWDHFVGDQNAKARAWGYVESLHQMVESGIGMIIMGESYGVGKSMLGILILKSCVMSGYRSYFTTYADMLSSMKAGWKDAEYAKWYKRRIDSARVLMIDDIGKELMDGSGFNNEFAKQTLDATIRTRTQQGRPTIITTNFREADIESAYGKAMWSLITEQSMAVVVGGADYRPRMQKMMKGRRRIY